MGAFSFKKKKKLKLRKREELAKPEGYRVPWSDGMSPLKILFDVRDERNGMKFARVQMDDGEIHALIMQEGLWRCLTGDAPQEVVDHLAAGYTAKHPDGDELPDDDEIRKVIQERLEALNKCKVILTPAQPDGDDTVELMPTTWTRMLVLDLYARANKVEMWLDAEADLVVSGYDLFARGVLDQHCMFNRDPLEPSPEDRQEFADIFDLLESGNAIKEANKRAKRLMMFTYEGYLTEFADRAFQHPNPDFKGHLENNIRAVRQWMGEQMIELGNMPEGTTVVFINAETGEMEHVLGPEEPLTDEFLQKNEKQLERHIEAARKREVA